GDKLPSLLARVVIWLQQFEIRGLSLTRRLALILLPLQSLGKHIGEFFGILSVRSLLIPKSDECCADGKNQNSSGFPPLFFSPYSLFPRATSCGGKEEYLGQVQPFSYLLIISLDLQTELR